MRLAPSSGSATPRSHGSAGKAGLRTWAAGVSGGEPSCAAIELLIGVREDFAKASRMYFPNLANLRQKPGHSRHKSSPMSEMTSAWSKIPTGLARAVGGNFGLAVPMHAPALRRVRSERPADELGAGARHDPAAQRLGQPRGQLWRATAMAATACTGAGSARAGWSAARAEGLPTAPMQQESAEGSKGSAAHALGAACAAAVAQPGKYIKKMELINSTTSTGQCIVHREDGGNFLHHQHCTIQGGWRVNYSTWINLGWVRRGVGRGFAASAWQGCAASIALLHYG
jgi:hypothetical protein